jgi:amino acid transporter
MGYLLACALALVGYYLYRTYHPDVARPFRLPSFVRYVALGIGLFFLVIWAVGGYLAADYVVAADQRWLFFLGLAILAAYLPLYWWRQARDPLVKPQEAPAIP